MALTIQNIYSSISKQEILDISRENGFWALRDIEFTRETFLDFCKYIGTVWPGHLHDLHTESYDDDGVVDWSSNTRFKSLSIPWHADNPWNEHYRFPIRVFGAVTIPDPKDGPLEFLNQGKWFSNLPEDRKEYLRSLRVLTEDYKGACQPYWSSFVKKHPITGNESLFWGSMVVHTNTYGLAPDEGHRFNHFASTMAIIKPSREIVSDEEISSWFEEMLKDYYSIWEFREKDLLVMDNWDHFHYRRTLTHKDERLLFRKTVLQPWQKIIGTQ